MRCFLIAFSIVVVPGGSLVRAEGDPFLKTRSWTSKEGKSLQATLTRATPRSVLLKVSRTGKVVEIPLDRLSAADRQATVAWLRENPDGLVPPRPPFRWGC